MRDTLATTGIDHKHKPNYRIFFCHPASRKPAGPWLLCEYNTKTRITVIAYPCQKGDQEAIPVRDDRGDLIYFGPTPSPSIFL